VGDKVWEIERPPIARYVGFSAVTLLLTLLLMCLAPFFFGHGDFNTILGVPWLIVFLLFWGSPLWLPVFLISLFPGFSLYRWLVGVLFPTRTLPLLAVSIAAIVVSLLSSLGIPIGLFFFGTIAKGSEMFDIGNYWPVLFGIPASVSAAYLILYKKES